MKNNKENKLNIVTIIVFILIIFIPQIVFFFIKDYIEIDYSENRKLETKPEFSYTTMQEYPTKYEQYYNDNLPFRGALKKIWTNLNFFIFNDSSCENVVIGEDDKKGRQFTWLFYCNSADYNPVAEAQGITKFEEEDKETIYNNLISNTEKMQERGIELYYLICPNKENIYKDKLPSQINILNNESRTDKLVKELKKRGISNIVYPKDELIKEKDNYQEYYRQDTHWNNYGSFIGFKSIMSTMEPSYNKLEYEIECSKGKIQNKDLTSMLGINDYFKDDEINVKYLESNEYIISKVNASTYELVFTECDNAEIDKTIMIVGDSYRNAMIEYFAKTYNKCIVLHRCDYEPSMLDEYSPDILLYENVERYTPLLENLNL